MGFLGQKLLFWPMLKKSKSEPPYRRKMVDICGFLGSASNFESIETGCKNLSEILVLVKDYIRKLQTCKNP